MFKGKVLLASQSPRRRDILKLAGINFRIVIADIDENHDGVIEPARFPEHLAMKKAEAVSHSAKQDEIILAADTIVLMNSIIYGKPTDRQDAFRILNDLSGKTHDVISGVCLKSQRKEKVFSVITKVYFNPLSAEQIEYYVEHYKPFDKAGAYAIQEWIGVVGIKKIEGCYFNVMGLPMSRVWAELNNW